MMDGKTEMLAIMCKSAVLGALLAVVLLIVGMQAPGAAWAKDEPQASNPFEDAIPATVSDGEYLVDLAMEGGTGRATVASPAKLAVENGLGAVTVAWSSPNFDYMVVAGKKYLPTNDSGDSVFVIPVTAYDEPVGVVADTTAMSEPHEIEYTFTYDSSSIQLYEANKDAALSTDSASSSSKGSADDASAADNASAAGTDTASTMPRIVLIACVVVAAVFVGIIVGILRSYRNR